MALMLTLGDLKIVLVCVGTLSLQANCSDIGKEQIFIRFFFSSFIIKLILTVFCEKVFVDMCPVHFVAFLFYTIVFINIVPYGSKSFKRHLPSRCTPDCIGKMLVHSSEGSLPKLLKDFQI